MKEGIDISTSSNQVNVSLDSSISGEVSEWRKWVILHDQPVSIAENVWDFGKEVELNCNFEQGEMIGELTEIEKRDRLKANIDSGKLKDVGMVTNCDH
ncbi:hypothetical protein A2U01_0025923 [Trifolium medium]|uniref:Uncharacterized protein n=1 Tax=Trifolium medium TaxID=97028 RepID=A0A392P238_9FABA|nr:hypothetical protein [Trifolium medium]